VNLQSLLDQKGYVIALTESDLNGPERFVADGVITEEQCQQLIQLANVCNSVKNNALTTLAS
jgi:hypothetical protein